MVFLYGSTRKNSFQMKQVFYNGHSYEYTVSEKDGTRLFSLYEKGVLRYNLTENDLDKRTMVSFILDSYYTKDRHSAKAPVPQ